MAELSLEESNKLAQQAIDAARDIVINALKREEEKRQIIDGSLPSRSVENQKEKSPEEIQKSTEEAINAARERQAIFGCLPSGPIGTPKPKEKSLEERNKLAQQAIDTAQKVVNKALKTEAQRAIDAAQKVVKNALEEEKKGSK